MNKFFKNFFKFLVITFGILFLLAVMALGTILFIGIDKSASDFGVNITTSMANALQISTTATFTNFVMALSASIFSNGGDASSLLAKLNELDKIISISLISVTSVILGSWMIFAFFHAITTKKIAGLYFSKKWEKQLSQLEKVQEKVDMKVQWLSKKIK